MQLRFKCLAAFRLKLSLIRSKYILNEILPLLSQSTGFYAIAIVLVKYPLECQ